MTFFYIFPLALAPFYLRSFYMFILLISFTTFSLEFVFHTSKRNDLIDHWFCHHKKMHSNWRALKKCYTILKFKYHNFLSDLKKGIVKICIHKKKSIETVYHSRITYFRLWKYLIKRYYQKQIWLTQ